MNNEATEETFLDDATYDALIAAIRDALRPDESAVKMLLAEIAGIFPARVEALNDTSLTTA